jgi:hypothetical protein
MNNTVMDNIEVNVLTNVIALQVSNCINTIIRAVRIEVGEFELNNTGLIELANYSGPTRIDGINAQNIKFNPNIGTNTYFMLDAGFNSYSFGDKARSIVVDFSTITNVGGVYVAHSTWVPFYVEEPTLSANTGEPTNAPVGSRVQMTIDDSFPVPPIVVPGATATNFLSGSNTVLSISLPSGANPWITVNSNTATGNVSNVWGTSFSDITVNSTGAWLLWSNSWSQIWSGGIGNGTNAFLRATLTHLDMDKVNASSCEWSSTNLVLAFTNSPSLSGAGVYTTAGSSTLGMLGGSTGNGTALSISEYCNSTGCSVYVNGISSSTYHLTANWDLKLQY